MERSSPPGYSGNGGIVLTDEPYGDFEVALEMNNDFGLDSGLSFGVRMAKPGRRGRLPRRGNLMGIYGEDWADGPASATIASTVRPTEL